MKKQTLTKLLLGLSLSVVFLNSCQKDKDLTAADQPVITDDIKANFEDLGFDVSDIEVVTDNNPLTGESETKYLLEQDIMISEQQMKDMLTSEIFHEGVVGEQYRTFNLVSSPQTINVIGYTGGSNALTSKMRTALQWAVANYNRLNIGLNFTLTFGTNYQPYDIVVYRTSGGAGGSAGFPSGGAPNKFVQIFSGTNNYDTNVVEHVITHEIGHSVGLRHTDFFNRSLSCGSGGNEGSGGVGAVHIPGTPTGFDPNSIMLSCFSANEDGEFGFYDEVALEYLY